MYDANANKDSVYEFNNASKTAVGGLSVVLAVLCVVLVMREAFQMLASFKRYFLSPENVMELTIIALTLAIVFAGDEGGTFQVKRHLAAVCVVLSWMEVLLLIGRHPRSVLAHTHFMVYKGWPLRDDIREPLILGENV